MVRAPIRNGILTGSVGRSQKSPTGKTGIHSLKDSSSNFTPIYPTPLIGQQISSGTIIGVQHKNITNCWKQTRFAEFAISFVLFIISAIFMSLFSNGTISNLQTTGGIVGFVIATLLMLVSLGNFIRHIFHNHLSKNPKPLCPNGMDHIRMDILQG